MLSYLSVFGFLAHNSLRILKSYGIVSLTLKASPNIVGDIVGHEVIYKFQWLNLEYTIFRKYESRQAKTNLDSPKNMNIPVNTVTLTQMRDPGFVGYKRIRKVSVTLYGRLLLPLFFYSKHMTYHQKQSPRGVL